MTKLPVLSTAHESAQSPEVLLEHGKLEDAKKTLINEYSFEPELLAAYFSEGLGSLLSDGAVTEDFNGLTEAYQTSVESVLRAVGYTALDRAPSSLNMGRISRKGVTRESLFKDETFVDSVENTISALEGMGSFPLSTITKNEFDTLSQRFNWLGKAIPNIKSDADEANELYVIQATMQVESIIKMQEYAEAIRHIGSRSQATQVTSYILQNAPLLCVYNPDFALVVKEKYSELLNSLAKEENEPIEFARTQFERLAAMSDRELYLMREFKHVRDQSKVDGSPNDVQTDIAEIDGDSVSDQVEKIAQRPVEVLEAPRELSEDARVELHLLLGEVDAFNSEWLAIGKKWRERGFSSLNEAMVRQHGLYDKIDSVAVIGILAKLHTLEGSQVNQAAIDALEKALAAREYLSQSFSEYMAENGMYDEVKQDSKGVHLLDLAGKIDTIKQNWTKISSSVLRTWPSEKGQEVVDKLEGMFFGLADDEAAEPLAPEVLVETDSLDTGEVYDFSDIVEQLDEVILPEGSTLESLNQQLEKLDIDNSVKKVEWQKLEDLIMINSEFNGKIYRSKIKSHGQSDEYATVYYVSVIEVYGRRFAIAETPESRNATYIVDEFKSPGTWIEMLQLDKRQLREVGGKQMIHTSIAPYGKGHQEKVIDHILELSAED